MTKRSKRLMRILLTTLVLTVGGMWYAGCRMISMPGKSFSGPLLPLTDEQIAMRDAMREHVRVLSVDIGERNVPRYPQLVASADYIERTLRGFGYTNIDSKVYQVYTSQRMTSQQRRMRKPSRPPPVRHRRTFRVLLSRRVPSRRGKNGMWSTDIGMTPLEQQERPRLNPERRPERRSQVRSAPSRVRLSPRLSRALNPQGPFPHGRYGLLNMATGTMRRNDEEVSSQPEVRGQKSEVRTQR